MMSAQRYEADLHIHTLLSPCAEIEMIPSLIVEAASRAGLDIIGIADHNSCENAGAVIEASVGSGIRVLPGIEVQSMEGVHLLCLFDGIEQAEGLQTAVYDTLIEIEAAKRYHDKQMVVDAHDEFVDYCRRAIALPSTMDINEVSERTFSLGGIVIPSHIDRHATGLCSMLGMVPDEPDFPAVEISRNISPLEARAMYPSIGSRAILCNSDSHWLASIGERRTTLYLEHRTVAEIAMACRNQSGRRVCHA